MIKKSLFLAFISFLFISNLFSQNFLKAKVENEKNEALSGAVITVKGTNIQVLSNSEGVFELKNLKNGLHVFQISFVGYEKLETEILIPNNEFLSFKLKESSFLSEEIVVKATRADQKTPFSYSNLEKDEIKSNYSGEDIPFLLNLMPSVVNTSETGIGIGYTGIRIRGSDASRINVTINGIPLNDSESHSVFWVNMPDFANSVSSVQVQRGVGTSTNGAGAFGASVNFKTESINPQAFAEINADFGSFSTYKTSIKAGSGLINQHFAFDIRLSSIQTDGFVRNGFANHKSFALNAAYLTPKSFFKVNIISGNQKTGITWWGNPQEMLETDRTYNPSGQYTDYYGNTKYYDNETDNYIQTHYQLHFSHEINSNLNINLSAHYTRGDGYYEEYKPTFDGWDYNTFESYGLPDIELNTTEITVGDKTFQFPESKISASDMIRRKMLANDFYGGVFSLNYIGEKFDFSFGTAANIYDGDHFGKILWSAWNGDMAKNYQWYFNNATKKEMNAFAKINYALSPKINLFADAQFRTIAYKMEGLDDDFKDLKQEHQFNFFNPKAGIWFTITQKQSAYASFAVAHREPTRTNFKDASGDILATPKAEILYDYEIGYQFLKQNFQTQVNFYYMDYFNQLVPTGEKSDVGYDIMSNVENSYRTGVELVTCFKLSSWFEWNFSTTLSQNKIKNFVEYADYYDADWNDLGHNAKELGETNIAYSPNIILGNSFTFYPIKNLSISLLSKYVGEQYFDNTSSENRKLEAYFVNNLLLKYDFRIKNVKNISFRFQVNNLLNSEYSSNAYGGNYYVGNEEITWAYYFPQAGIHFLTGIAFRF